MNVYDERDHLRGEVERLEGEATALRLENERLSVSRVTTHACPTCDDVHMPPSLAEAVGDFAARQLGPLLCLIEAEPSDDYVLNIQRYAAQIRIALNGRQPK